MILGDGPRRFLTLFVSLCRIYIYIYSKYVLHIERRWPFGTYQNQVMHFEPSRIHRLFVCEGD